jgi:tetratricopeptide (TPR) repeat protein
MVELDDMNPMYFHMLAVAHYKVFEYEQAIMHWERIFELHEKWGSHWQHPFAYFFLADAYLQLQDYEKGDKIIQAGYELFPRNGYIQTYRLILTLVQNNTAAIDNIMEEYLSFRNNVTHCPEALITNDLGYIYTQAGQLNEAEKHYRLAIQQDPQNLQYQFNLAKFLIEEEIQVDEGLEIVDRLLEKFPNHFAALSYKGWALYQKGNYDEALKFLRSGWEKKPIYNHLYYLHLQEAEKAVASES